MAFISWYVHLVWANQCLNRLFNGTSGYMIPQSKDDPVQACGWCGDLFWLLTIFIRGKERVLAPMPGMVWEVCSPLKDLIPIKSKAGSSQDKGKGKENAEMDEGMPEEA